MAPRRVVICGAAGRDFHNFNVLYRDDPAVEVVAFTATQIPGIDQRRYPPVLAGERYPNGIPIVPEAELESLLDGPGAAEVMFAYSDVTHAQVMKLGCRALATGADFRLGGPDQTMLRSRLPVIAVCAVRTGCGKSQVSRHLVAELARRGRRCAAVRHPMPYGDLSRQIVQRFASRDDLTQAGCTLEEREEYEPHIANGGVVFAGVDYGRILAAAEAEADLVVWDGGNNDFAFFRPDLCIVVVDALRPEQLDTHYPGAAVLRTADLVIVNKVGAATAGQLATIRTGLDTLVPGVPRVEATSPVTLDAPDLVAGRRVLVVEDGPTITHGGMPHGAGYLAATELGATIVNPRTAAAPGIAAVYERYPHIGPVLPAMGYGPAELEALRQTIDAADIDVVVAGTPIDLARAVELTVPVVRARYAYADAGSPGLMAHVDAFLERSTVRRA